VNNFFKNTTQKLSKWPYLLLVTVMSLLAFVIKIPLILATDWLLNAIGLGSVELFSAEMQIPDITASAFLFGVVLAPFLETIIGQFLPINFILNKGRGVGSSILVSSTVFSMLHFPVLEFLPGAFAVGVVLALTYVARLKKGRNDAIVTTSIVHAIHNLLAFIVTWAFPA
jgi:membrane protease YdiL (CAAX protease family)